MFENEVMLTNKLNKWFNAFKSENGLTVHMNNNRQYLE
jgi:hypothetical protein